MINFDSKFTDTIELLQGEWEVKDYQLAGMGWAAVISKGSSLFTLHSERGWVDIYLGKYQDQNVLACKNTPYGIAEVINSNAT